MPFSLRMQAAFAAVGGQDVWGRALALRQRA
jgi:hypothetical protein